MYSQFFSKNIQRILVTGGAGFIGSTLIKKLLSYPSIKVYNLDKLSYSSDLSQINRIINKEKFTKERYEFIKVDLFNKSETSEAITYSNPDLVFHLAAETHVDRSIDNPNNFLMSNIIGTFNLLETLRIHWENLTRDRKKFFKLIHISTDEVYGSLESKNSFFNELTPYCPNSPYSATKASSDHLVNAWHKTYGIPVNITNCSNNFGPYQFPEKFIPLIVLKAIQKEKIPIYGNGLNIRDWLFVEDHAEALIKVSLEGRIGETYCIGGSNEYTNNEVALKICEILDKVRPLTKPYKNLITHVEDRPGHDLRYAIDAKKMKNELNWEPKYKFLENLTSTVHWYLENLLWCENMNRKSGYKGERLGINK